jgi:hypothetical protein
MGVACYFNHVMILGSQLVLVAGRTQERLSTVHGARERKASQDDRLRGLRIPRKCLSRYSDIRRAV